jgi:glyoxylase I family protein
LFELERSKKFYKGVVGLNELERPDFGYPGAWFAVGDSGHRVHLSVHDGETWRQGGIDVKDGHFAIASAVIRQQKNGSTTVAYHILLFIRSFNVLDPDNNIIEFRADHLDT